MNCEGSKKKTSDPLTVYKDEKEKKNISSFFRGFDDFKINYSFNTKDKCSDDIEESSLDNDSNRTSFDKEYDIKQLIKLINNTYIDKHLYFKKLSINDLYKIFVYSNFLARSLILYPSLINHFENIIEKFKKVKNEISFPLIDEHFEFSFSSIIENEYNELKQNEYNKNSISHSFSSIKKENVNEDAQVSKCIEYSEGVMTPLNTTRCSSRTKAQNKSSPQERPRENISNITSIRITRNTKIGKDEEEDICDETANTMDGKTKGVSLDEVGNTHDSCNKKIKEQNKIQKHLKNDFNSTYENENEDKNITIKNSKKNINDSCSSNNMHTKVEINKNNGNGVTSPVNHSLHNVFNPSLGKNVRIYKNINEYDIIELKISTSFNNKYICRYIGNTMTTFSLLLKAMKTLLFVSPTTSPFFFFFFIYLLSVFSP
ncbi:conserved Plasmodium protein, unknown function, fragment [Plasmodium ovale wallikeri]|uniref:Uncharacterized protein n=1 Tax=Plasmodium ovale wallikeri TaxID=864142 RepID=A0A1A8YXJ6_PLAOA|nr:conserved Plasmodium protein, unknown function, fragment [Plasmodium ovale wallikeri]SBT36299.1 conserved Plasmodium protein, unknown function, fragment [Plasmodium ovale wallikeri]